MNNGFSLRLMSKSGVTISGVKMIGLALVAIWLTSCGTYRHYQPTPNPALFYHQGDFSLSGNIGTSGTSLKASVAVADHIGIIGMYHGGLLSYEVNEGEVGIGYYNSQEKHAVFLAGGLAFGSNSGYSDDERTTKLYKGNFRKPFMQFNYGIRNQKLILGIRGDVTAVLKGIFVDYKGNNLNDANSPIRSDYTIIEPGIILGLGSKNLKFNFGYTFPITMRIEDPLSSQNDARTFPVTVSVGLRYTFNSKAEDD